MAAWVEAARSALWSRQFVAELLHLGQHRGFQAGERKVQIAAAQQGPGQTERCRIALFGQTRQRRPAGITQTEQLGGLVKSLARRVVDWFRPAACSHPPRRPASAGYARRRPAGPQRGIGADRRSGRAKADAPPGGASHRTVQRCAQAQAHRHRPAAHQTGPPCVGNHVDGRQITIGPGKDLPGSGAGRAGIWSRLASSGTTPP